MSMAGSELQIVLTAGVDDIPRAMLAFETALVSACSDIEVAVFLTLHGSIWACRSVPPGAAEPVNALIDQLLDSGVAIECCSRCADQACLEEAGQRGDDLRPGVGRAGLATFVARAARGVPTVTF